MMDRSLFLNLSLVVILSVGGTMSVLFVQHAHTANAQHGFPLDDSWIHLQFAKNLYEYGSFSYYRDEMPTSGSTAPLYTALLAAGFFITSDEMILSYTLGILSLLGAAALTFFLARRLFGNSLIALGAALLVLLEPRLQFIAVSGMETTLFIVLLLAAALAYIQQRHIALGILTGLLVWTRPEGIIFVGVLMIDQLVRLWINRPSGKKNTGGIPWPQKKLIQALAVFSGFAIGYVSFNLILSDSLLPNTFGAKIAFYGMGRDSYITELSQFLSGDHFLLISLFATIHCFSIGYALVRRRYSPSILLVGWTAGLILAYGFTIPFLYQEGRYLMPILPFIILLGAGGLTDLVSLISRLPWLRLRDRWRGVALAALMAVLVVQFGFEAWNMRSRYAGSCGYIAERQVKTARWIRENVAADAIVGTHDIGAVAFYSGRRIVDMVGLVSPEMIQNMGRFDRLQQFLIRNHVTHLAVLRSWFEIVNVNPVFQTDEEYPEVMDVLVFDPQRMRFTPQDATRLRDAALRQLTAGKISEAGSLLERSLQLDPFSSRSRLALAQFYLYVSQIDRAEAELRAALSLHPDSWDARYAQAVVANLRNQPAAAIDSLQVLVKENPDYLRAFGMLGDLYSTYGIDSVKAKEYRERSRKPREKELL